MDINTSQYFLKLNTGIPQLPLGGGYSAAPPQPNNRAPVSDIVPAGTGPIGQSEQFDRVSFLSQPPMGHRAYGGLDAIIYQETEGPGLWPY